MPTLNDKGQQALDLSEPMLQPDAPVRQIDCLSSGGVLVRANTTLQAIALRLELHANPQSGRNASTHAAASRNL